MNFFSQLCPAPSASPKLRAKQGHAMSATAATHNSKPHSRFLTFVHSHIWIPFRPSRLLRAKALVSVSRNCGARPGTAGREQPAFTLIELMAATTVLSIILLMMVGMQDQMSKAWSNANRRTDATREARAAASLLATDFAFPFTRGKRNPSNARDQMADSTTNNGVPFCYSSNGTGSGITIPNQLAGSACLFAAATQRPQGSSSGDLALVGYYVAKRSWTNVNGFTSDSYNLHRYFRPASNAWTNLSNWFKAQDPKNLFPDVNPAVDDVLAKNVAGFNIIFFTDTAKPITNGVNYSIESSGNPYPGNKMQISIDIYPDDAAQKFTSDSTWANPTNIKRSSRTYEFRIDSPRS